MQTCVVWFKTFFFYFLFVFSQFLILLRGIRKRKRTFKLRFNNFVLLFLTPVLSLDPNMDGIFLEFVKALKLVRETQGQSAVVELIVLNGLFLLHERSQLILMILNQNIVFMLWLSLVKVVIAWTRILSKNYLFDLGAGNGNLFWIELLFLLDVWRNQINQLILGRWVLWINLSVIVSFKIEDIVV